MMSRRLQCSIGLLCITPSLSQNGDTSVITSLNSQIAEGHRGVFTGGKGVLVRTPDFFSGGSNVVVPASFWVNDIKAASQAYPSGNPWCPHGHDDGFENIDFMKCDRKEGPWSYATMSAVIGVDGMYQLMSDFDNIQSKTWGWGVFYATDANAGDQRCRYNGDTSQGDKGWDCPGYWIGDDGTSYPNPAKKGAGMFAPGNPYAGGGGGGAGCHFQQSSGKIDQTDATDKHGQNLVQDSDCQCNYFFNKDWNGWVDNWIQHTKQKAGFEGRSWLGGGHGKAPAWAVDVAACWVSNPRDMIGIQNALWSKRGSWLNFKAPYDNSDHTQYWGWNEVPVSMKIADDPKWWDAVMIKLPANLVSIGQLGGGQQQQLEKDLDSWVAKKHIIPGATQCSKRPGSYMVVVRETKKGGHDSSHYVRTFYCEAWTSPGKKYQLVYHAPAGKDGGACFIDYAPKTSAVVV